MKKAEILKVIVSVIAIILLAVVIVNANKLVMPKVQTTIEEAAVPSVQVDTSGCFKDSGTVVFVHSNSCPHCRNMVPIIQELEGEGYKFYWAEGSDAEARQIMSECFSDIMSGYVPQFICPANRKQVTGEMSKQELKDFTEGCFS